MLLPWFLKIFLFRVIVGYSSYWSINSKTLEPLKRKYSYNQANQERHMYNINNLEVFLRRLRLVVDCICDGRNSLLSPFTVTAGNWKWLSVTLNAL